MSFPEGIVFLDWANGVLIADEGNNRVSFDYMYINLAMLLRPGRFFQHLA